MIAQLRSGLFMLVFFTGSVPIVMTAPILALFGHRALKIVVMTWVGYHSLCARLIAGIVNRVEGAPLNEPALYAAKHQALYETFELMRILDGPVVVMRREFARIPVWGWAATKFGLIVIDREGSAATMRQIMREAAAAKAAGRSVLIFPEGTRVPPGTTPPIKPGLAGLYRTLAMPTVPIALDSGLRWPRQGPKRPGPVNIVFGDTLPPGLPRKEIEPLIHAGINALETSVV
jgi:1-acyl-sn-glycerol-3-phosphate acyltransferase